MNFKKIIIYVLIGFVVSAVVFGAFFLIYMNNSQNGERVVNLKTYEYDIGEFSTNLGSTKSFFKGSIMLESTDKKLDEKLEEKNAQIRDSIITILIGKKSNEILEPEGQVELKKEILEAITDIVNSDTITKIYFVDYIIQ